MSYTRIWIVDAGESLSFIAQILKLCPPAGTPGFTAQQIRAKCLAAAGAIASDNGISNPDLIQPGRALRITVPDQPEKWGPERLSVEDVAAGPDPAPRTAGVGLAPLALLALLLVRAK